MSVNVKKLPHGTVVGQWYEEDFEDYTENRLPNFEVLGLARYMDDYFLTDLDRKHIRKKKPMIKVFLEGASNYKEWDSQFREWLAQQDQCVRHYETGLISAKHIDPSVIKHYVDYEIGMFQALVRDIDLALVAFLTTSLSNASFPNERKLSKNYHNLRRRIDDQCLLEAAEIWPEVDRGRRWYNDLVQDLTEEAKETSEPKAKATQKDEPLTPYTKHSFVWSTGHDYHIVNDKKLFWWFRETDPKEEASKGRLGVRGIGIIKAQFNDGTPIILPNVAYIPESELIYSEMAARGVGISLTLTSRGLNWNRAHVGKILPRPLLDMGILSTTFLPSNKPEEDENLTKKLGKISISNT